MASKQTRVSDVITHISPEASERLFDVSELWRYRELFYIFVWRDLKVRYRQTMLGIIWVIIQPVTNTFIFTILFGTLAKIPSGNIPYTLFVLCGVIYWSFFSTSLGEAIETIVANQGIIKKVYFPKMILIFSSVLTRLVDFGIMFVLLIGYAWWIGYPPDWKGIVIFPLMTLMSAVTASGLGLFAASLNVTYRDVRYVIPFLIQVMFYATPIVYSLGVVRKEFAWILALNPMTTVIESSRYVFSHETALRWEYILLSFCTSITFFILGIWYFKRTQRFFADVI